ncbi:MAG: dephospho-CoA kinase [Thiobacillaceae bacterium]
MSRPYCVALTGGLAAGKSAVAEVFARLGAAVIDTDAIARELTGPQGAALPALKAAFGPGCLNAEGALDRAAMRARVFQDAQARRRLEAILHPMIRERVRERLAAVQAPYAVVVVPLLAEAWADYRPLLDRVLLVDCDEAAQVRRVMARDGIDADLARRMLAAQATRQQRLALADDVIDNRGDLAALARQVEALHDRYLKLAAARGNPLPRAG